MLRNMTIILTNRVILFYVILPVLFWIPLNTLKHRDYLNWDTIHLTLQNTGTPEISKLNFKNFLEIIQS